MTFDRSKFEFCIALLIVFRVLVPTIADTPKPFEDAKLDIAFLLDESGSIDAEEYQKLKHVMVMLPDVFPMGPTRARFGLVAFSTSSEIIRGPASDGWFDKEEDFKRAIENRKKVVGMTATYRGLQNVEKLFDNEDSSRRDSSNILIILTDGCSFDDNLPANRGDEKAAFVLAINLSTTAARRLRAKGVVIFVVHVGDTECDGIGKSGISAEDAQMGLVGEQNKNRRIEVKNFDNLTREVFDAIKKEIQQMACSYDQICAYVTDKGDNCTSRTKKKDTIPDCIVNPPSAQECKLKHCGDECLKQNWIADTSCVNVCNHPNPLWCDECKRCVTLSSMTTTTNGSTGRSATGPGDKRRVLPGDPSVTKSPGSQVGLFVGIAIGVLCLIVMLLVLAAFLVKRHRRLERVKKHDAIVGSKDGASSISVTSGSRMGSKTVGPQSGKSATGVGVVGGGKLQTKGGKDAAIKGTPRESAESKSTEWTRGKASKERHRRRTAQSRTGKMLPSKPHHHVAGNRRHRIRSVVPSKA